MRWLLLTLIALQAASCGQSGPLVLPDQTLAPSATAPHPGGRPR
jgi:predicted small lipoprotein YifL